MSKEREIDGIKIVVNGEQYEAYKGTLQDEIKKQSEYIEMLQNNIEKLVEENGEKARRINKAIEYIKERTTDEDIGEYLGYSDMIDDEILLNILKGR